MNNILQSLHGMFGLDQKTGKDVISPLPSQQYDPRLSALTKVIQLGFQNYGSPLATEAASFAQAGKKFQDQYSNVDPLIMAVLALKETSGGKNMAKNSANNPLNIGPNINYPDISTNLMGGGTWGNNGGPQQGFMGTMKNPAYSQYERSGNMSDFFSAYSPQYNKSGSQINPDVQDQVRQYNTLRDYFTNAIARR